MKFYKKIINHEYFIWPLIAAIILSLPVMIFIYLIKFNIINLLYLLSNSSLEYSLVIVFSLFSLLIACYILYLKSKNQKQISKIPLSTSQSPTNVKLERALALAQATLEATADGILVIDENRKLASCNEKFRQMWNIPDDIMSSGDDEAGIKHVLSQLKDPQAFLENIDKFYNRAPDSSAIGIGLIEFKDGRIIERYTMPQRLGNKIIGRVFSFRDVTQRVKLEEQLRHQATHDALTSLPNRTLLLDRINQAIKYAKRNRKTLAVLFFDLDRFKLINDSFGHEMGDILLQATAKRLQSYVRETDTVARWGGDEFVILLNSIKSKDEAASIAKKCLSKLEEIFKIDKHSLNITCSVGVSFFPHDGKDAGTLLKTADAAMYYAKTSGRNTFQFYTAGMSERTQEMLSLENDLRRAIEHHELTLHYQPIVDLQTGMPIGAEARVRWIHPKRGMISPLEFIPLAEETGLIGSIGEWAVRTACKQNKAWHDQGLPLVSVSVNFSGQQFRQKNIAAIVHDILAETKLNPRYLELELTESTMIESTHVFLEILNDLKKVGVGLVIDDFGTGYSSLSYLKRFPLDTLKVDQSFIRDVSSDPYDAAIVRAILAMASQLNLKVVAEGIETHDELAFLRKHGCQLGQGSLFSKPVDSKTFAKLLKKKTLMPRRVASELKAFIVTKNKAVPYRPHPSA